MLSLIHFGHRSDLVLPRTSGYKLYAEPRRGDYTNHVDCLRSGRTGLSPLAVYPTIPAEYETNKGNPRPMLTFLSAITRNG